MSEQKPIVNEYRPWEERGETELQYAHRAYLELSRVNGEQEQRIAELERVAGGMAEAVRRLLVLRHSGHNGHCDKCRAGNHGAEAALAAYEQVKGGKQSPVTSKPDVVDVLNEAMNDGKTFKLSPEVCEELQRRHDSEEAARKAKIQVHEEGQGEDSA